VLLRRSAGGTRTSRGAGERKIAEAPDDQENLGRALRGYREFRAIPDAKRNRSGEVFPERLEERTEAAIPGAVGHAGQELEIFGVGCEGTRVLGRVSRGV